MEAMTLPHLGPLSRAIPRLLQLIIRFLDGSSPPQATAWEKHVASRMRTPSQSQSQSKASMKLEPIAKGEHVRIQMAINRAWTEGSTDLDVEKMVAEMPALKSTDLPILSDDSIGCLHFHSLTSVQTRIQAESMYDDHVCNSGRDGSTNACPQPCPILATRTLRRNALAIFGHILYGLGCMHQLDRYAAVIEPVWRLADIIRQSSQQYEAAWVSMATNAVRGWIKQSEWENINHRSPSTTSSTSSNSSSPSIPSASSDCHDAAIHPRAISFIILPTLQHALNILSDSSHPSVSSHTQSHSSSNSMIDARQSAAEALRAFSHVIETGRPSPLLPHLMPDSQRMKDALSRVKASGSAGSQ